MTSFIVGGVRMSLLLARLWPSFQGLSCLLAFYALLRFDKVVAESQRYFRIAKSWCSLLDDSLGRLLHCITPILAISLHSARISTWIWFGAAYHRAVHDAQDDSSPDSVRTLSGSPLPASLKLSLIRQAVV